MDPLTHGKGDTGVVIVGTCLDVIAIWTVHTVVVHLRVTGVAALELVCEEEWLIFVGYL